MISESAHRSLSLSAEDEEDFAVISTLLQDAEVTLKNMTFLRDEHQFIVLVKRLVRETKFVNDSQLEAKTRVQTGLCFDGVKSVRTRGIIRENRNSLLRFLSVSYVQAEIAMIFSEGGAIKLQGDGMICLFRDLDTESEVGEGSV